MRSQLNLINWEVFWNCVQLQNDNLASDPDDEAIGFEGQEEVVLETGSGIDAPCVDFLDSGKDAANQNDTQSLQTEAENVT